MTTELFKRLVNPIEETAPASLVIGAYKTPEPTNFHQRRAREKRADESKQQARLNEFPRLIQEKRARERMERISEERKQLREYYKPLNRVKRLLDRLF